MVPKFSTTFKSTLILLSFGGLLSTGCGLKKPKDAIPVVGPPPPRYTYENDSPSSQPIGEINPEANPASNGFINVSLNEPADKLITDTQIVAYVNGEPILASEVLRSHPNAERLEAVRSQMPPEQYQQLRRQLIEQILQIHIDQRLLIQGFKSTLKKPQKEMLDDAISKMFSQEIEKLKAEFGVHSDYELEVELAKKNLSLETLQRDFGKRAMASEFMRHKAGTFHEPSRRELLEEYEKRKQKEYFRPARVRWQQILISYGANGGKQGAIEKLTNAAQELRNGTDFSDVAKKYSNGPGAAQGGYWDWMQKGSLTDRAVEDELFSMPVGRISDVLVGESSFQLVRVLDRENEHFIPFEKVQDALKDDLHREFEDNARRRVIEELRAKSVIQTMFDEPDLSETAAAPGPQIIPVGFQNRERKPDTKEESNPFAEMAQETGPFGKPASEPPRSEELKADTAPFAEPQTKPKPFPENEAPEPRESGNPISGNPNTITAPQPSPFESFTETSPFE